jgi:hypothetical protein
MERSRRVAAGSAADPVLRAALAEVAAATVRLSALDPITTELVRLRCARHHDCAT